MRCVFRNPSHSTSRFDEYKFSLHIPTKNEVGTSERTQINDEKKKKKFESYGGREKNKGRKILNKHQMIVHSGAHNDTTRLKHYPVYAKYTNERQPQIPNRCLTWLSHLAPCAAF